MYTLKKKRLIKSQMWPISMVSEVSIHAISRWYLRNLVIKRSHTHLDIVQQCRDGAAPTHNDFSHRMLM